MTTERTFTNADDERLSALVTAAEDVLIYVAPGVSDALSEALAAAIQRPNRPRRLSIVMDVDPEVCRLGFGTFNGLKKVKAALTGCGLELKQQRGLRIGLLIADSTFLCFSPTPLLIEAKSDVPEKPNAILLEVPGAAEKIQCAVADADPSALPPSDVSIGRDSVNESELLATEKDLIENPPKQFDLARIERVFSYALQFVEFKVLNYMLSSKNVHLEPEWLGLDDRELTRRITNQFKLFDRKEAFTIKIPSIDDEGKVIRGGNGRILSEKITERDITRMARRLREFLVPVGDYGNVIAKKRVSDFEQEVEVFRKKVAFYKRGTNREISKKVEDIKKRLIQELAPGLLETPPRLWLRSTLDGKLTSDQINKRLSDALDGVFKGIGDSFDPKVLIVYKDVTYTTIQDPGFKAKLEKFYGKDSITKLLDEYNAAREVRSKKSNQKTLFPDA
jgi:hypothetical protein